MSTGDSSNTQEGESSKDKKTEGNKRLQAQRPVNKSNNAPRQPKFEGKCDDLKGHIYDCSDSRQADQFAKTTKEVAEYVGRTYKYGGDARLAVENLELPEMVMPQDPPEGATKTENRIWEKEVDEYVKRKTYLTENIKTIYSLAWGQCSDIMRQKLEALVEFEALSAEGNGIALLKAIKALTYNFQSQKYLPHALHESKRRFYIHSQGQHVTTQAYLEQFQNIVDVIEHSGGGIGSEPGIDSIIAKEKGKQVNELTPADKSEAQDRYLAVAFILGSDRLRYGKLIENLENDYLQGRNSYPQNLTASYNLLINWKQDPRNLMRSVGVTNDGVSFTNIDGGDDDGVSLNTNGGSRRRKGPPDKSKITCRRCGEKGHYPSECDNERLVRPASGDDTSTSSTTSPPSAGTRQSGATLLLSGISEGEFEDDITAGFQFLNHANETVFQNNGSAAVPDTWILLDNQSTVDVFHNPRLLRNIREGNSYMDIHCNAGVTSTKLVGDLPGYGTVWYHPNGIANILSLARVKERGYKVTYDSDNGNSFNVIKPDGTMRIFSQSDRGLYYMDTAAANDNGLALVNTVADNRSRYTRRAYSRAVYARKLQAIIGRPNTRHYMDIVDRNLLPNCPISRHDIAAAEDIFGPDVGSLKGKTVRRPVPHASTKLIDVPLPLMKQYQNVTLAGDIMFVNRIPFFVTISHSIRFGTAEMLANRQASTILTAIKQVRNVYAQRGFRITTMILDGEFETLRGDLASLQIALQTASHDDHVPEIERHIRTLKERTRCIYNTLPFKRLPARIVIEMVYASTFWLNAFPHPDGVSNVLSPRSIVTGLSIDFHHHCRLEFGAYAQVHEDHDNSMSPRTTGALALRPTGNAQGSYHFFSLNTGRLLNRSRWTELPMPADVIARIHTLSRHGRNGLEFLNRDNQPFAPAAANDDVSDASDDDSSYSPDDDDIDDDDDPHFDIAGVYDHLNGDDDNNSNTDTDVEEDAAHNIGLNAANNNNEADAINYEPPIAAMPADLPAEIPGVLPLQAAEIPGVPLQPAETPGVPLHDAPPEPDMTAATEPPFNEHADMDARYGPRTSDHNLRPRRPRDYSHLHTVLEHTVMTQHNLKSGLKEFGEDGVNAVLKELQQLHDRKVLEPKNPDLMSQEEKKDALQYLMFLKKKRSGVIKGRGCADGRKQRLYTPKEEASSPTVAIESVMLSCVIDAMEARDVATVDIPGAFMQADMDDVVHMKLEGKMAELLVRIDPKLYRKHIQIHRGKQVLYVELKKALYGTLKAALLFWKKLTSTLESWGFTANPYDSCVVNKDIDGSQCTILWHVDDLKISHSDPNVVTSVVKQLEQEFGKEAPLTVTRGKLHDYLGMTIDYRTPGKVMIAMFDYIDNMLSELPEDMNGEAATPASNHLFQVDINDGTKLSEDQSVLFHHNVAKLLFLCKRARPDVQPPVAFLCTRVKSPDTDDYKKLARVMRYLRATRDMPLTLEATNMNVIKWWVDASFAVHPDMRSHTGAVMTLGRGAVFGMSTRQKLNTRSSTEGELVGVNDAMPQILWTRYFLQAQGHSTTESIIYQDNQSAILLEKNGRASSSKRTRHINIRYFFVTDRIAKKEVTVQYCPTGNMLADFFTKPLQGTPFRKFRDEIMNVDPAQLHAMAHRSVLEHGDQANDANGVRVEVTNVTDSAIVDDTESGGTWTLVPGKKRRKQIMEIHTKGHSTIKRDHAQING